MFIDNRTLGINTTSALVLPEDYPKSSVAETGTSLPAFSGLGPLHHRQAASSRNNPYSPLPSSPAVSTSANYSDWAYQPDQTAFQYSLIPQGRNRPPGTTSYPAAASLSASKFCFNVDKMLVLCGICQQKISCLLYQVMIMISELLLH